MQLTTGYEERRARIEIVPLIDVVFLLLVFFIYAMLSMTVHRGLKIDLPRTEGSIEKQNPVVITIDRENAIWLDGQPSDISRAVADSARMTLDGQRAVIISGDRQADLGVAIELLAAIRNAGVSAVSFQTMAASQE